jgi:hypothetical protein
VAKELTSVFDPERRFDNKSREAKFNGRKKTNRLRDTWIFINFTPNENVLACAYRRIVLAEAGETQG